MTKTLFDVLAARKDRWLAKNLELVESVTLEGAGLHDLDLGLYRIAVMRKGPSPKTEPLCPVCEKPASGHRDGLFCCGHCKGRAKHKTKRRGKFAGYHRVFCTECGARTTLWSDGCLADAAWNRRA